MKKMKHILFLSLALMLVAGCSSTKEEVLNPSAEVLYNQAFDLLQKTSYKKAAETFEKVELEHPYSKWALMLIIKTAVMTMPSSVLTVLSNIIPATKT